MLYSHRRQKADIAVDLGTARTTVVEPGSGVVFDEPSLCCFRAYDAVPAFVAAGAEAERLVGRVSKPLKMVNPLHNGVVSDMAAARELIRFATREVRPKRRFGRVRAIFGAPADATQAERRALEVAATDAGISEPHVIAEPILAAAGANLDVDAPRGTMVVDCGAGVTEAVVISMGGICAAASVRGGGDELTRSIIDHFRMRRRFRIGFSTAEQLKLEISRLLEGGALDAEISVSGLSSTDGLPQRLEVPVTELAPVWERDLVPLVAMVRQVLRATPPELSQDVLEDGIVLTGGGAHTAWLASRIAERTGVPTRIAEHARRAVTNGLSAALGRPLSVH
ncbi:rod shape-determining protein [Sphingosinicella sp. CPCC 101087]|uniref:rod shape-determining protein n=1 Tax=Sphingosinicella sp. CPCC 101087 TaxID=2497754 RepID=UPI00101B9BCD|nr:rod shape-determining protein [Sphingosinicella sp. CPCC 101087]